LESPITGSHRSEVNQGFSLSKLRLSESCSALIG